MTEQEESYKCARCGMPMHFHCARSAGCAWLRCTECSITQRMSDGHVMGRDNTS